MKIYSQYLELPEIKKQAEKESREQLLQWAVGEMVAQIYKEISEDYKTKDFKITLIINTGEGDEL